MADDFKYDVFLSHSAQDKAVVRDVAERLRGTGCGCGWMSGKSAPAKIVLLAMRQELVERALCLREHTPAGTLPIFPSYYRRERKELTGHPAVLVSYRFHGFLA